MPGAGLSTASPAAIASRSSFGPQAGSWTVKVSSNSALPVPQSAGGFAAPAATSAAAGCGPASEAGTLVIFRSESCQLLVTSGADAATRPIWLGTPGACARKRATSAPLMLAVTICPSSMSRRVFFAPAPSFRASVLVHGIGGTVTSPPRTLRAIEKNPFGATTNS